MKYAFLILFCLSATGLTFAQDERFFRKLFSGELTHEKKIEDEKVYAYLVHSPEYFIDINNDGINESIVSVKRDSEDWIDIYNSYREKIYSYRFETKGAHSGLYRVLRKQLDNNTIVLVLFYFEGDTNYINYDSSARIYLLTIDNKDLKTISMMKGPSIFEEFKGYKGDYRLRNYEVGVADLAELGKKQLYIKYRGVSKVFIYQGAGRWQTFRN